MGHSLHSIDFVKIKMVRESRAQYSCDEPVLSPCNVAKLLESILDLSSEPVEKCGVLLLDCQMKLNALQIIAMGTTDAAPFVPRDVFRAAISANATSVLFFHNHPSGDPTPSREDIKATERLVESGEILGINVVDHIIIGFNSYRSLQELGYM